MDKIAETDHSEGPLYAPKLIFDCPACWSDMKGDARVRFCSACQKNVYNLSEMTRKEAVNFMSEREGETCYRFFERKDGTIVTSDCFSIIGTERVRQKYPLLAAMNAYVSAGVLMLLPILGPAMITIRNGVGPLMTGRAEPTFVQSVPAQEMRPLPRLSALDRWFSGLMRKP